MVASFTRAAATELAGRDLPINREHLGTLHALCYHALGSPPLIQRAECINEWNKQHPAMQLSVACDSVDDLMVEPSYAKQGDQVFNDYMRLRALRATVYPGIIQEFDLAWRAFKADANSIDFTDMIELALRNTDKAPGAPTIGFFDEVQDFSRLELDLVRHWARNMDRVLLAGDDDQSIYWFKGATPEAFLDPPVPEEQNHVLRQSYRVPRAVQTAATEWIRQVARRQEKAYEPRDCEGEVAHSAATYNNPEALIDEIERIVSAGKTVMILATCTYMLCKMTECLRRYGIPFHNPYRVRQGSWNPLARHGRGADRLSSADRLARFMVPASQGRFWTSRELAQWVEVVKSTGVMPRGAKGQIDFFSDVDEEVTLDDMNKFFLPEHLPAIYAGDLSWFEQNLLATKEGVMRLPLAIARQRGMSALTEIPKVIVGTIHSVKGGEADEVILFPDISAAANEQWCRGGDARDAIIRTFYVGMTRARERLVICQQATNYAVQF